MREEERVSSEAYPRQQLDHTVTGVKKGSSTAFKLSAKGAHNLQLSSFQGTIRALHPINCFLQCLTWIPKHFG